MNYDELEALGISVRPGSAQTLSGGDTARASRAIGEDGPLLVKELSSPLPGMFAAEAAGLEWLGAAGMEVPRVIAATEDILVLSWIDSVQPTAGAAAAFGRELATLHSHEAPAFGVPPTSDAGWRPESGWVGAVPIEYGNWARWEDFYVEARLLPAVQLGIERGRLPRSAAAAVQSVCNALQAGDVSAGPSQPPSRIHGDLWSGNLLWTGESAAVIDPAAHGGHAETDLAMLSLFGAPYLAEMVAGYETVRPLGGSWRSRVSLHQLFPLLVHAAMFGGGYGHQVESAAHAALKAGRF